VPLLGVYAPSRNSELAGEVLSGSAIVGSEAGDTGRLRLDFEGDEEQYPTFEDRLQRAAERHTWERPDGSHGYPTAACAYVDSSEVVQVGRYDPHEGELKVSDEKLLSRWKTPPRTPM
jgi:hypothetical protein